MSHVGDVEPYLQYWWFGDVPIYGWHFDGTFWKLLINDSIVLYCSFGRSFWCSGFICFLMNHANLSHTLSVYGKISPTTNKFPSNQPIHRGKCVYGGVDPWKGPPFIGKGSKGTPEVDHMGMGQNSIYIYIYLPKKWLDR